MKEIFSTTKGMVRVWRRIQAALDTKENIKRGRETDTAGTIGRTELTMLEAIKIINSTDLAFMFGLMVDNAERSG